MSKLYDSTLGPLVRAVKRSLGYESNKERFVRYAAKNRWDDGESVSGPGSTVEYTENIRKEIPALLEKLGVRSFFDAPCGDYNWFRLVELPDGVSYLGGEIVPALVESNTKSFAADGVAFTEFDIINDALPTVDLWMCRDVLFHFSYQDAFSVLRSLFASDVRYFLTTTHPECEANRDIRTGSFRQINLLKPPFSFPEPLSTMADWVEGFPVRELGLWDVAALKEHLASNAFLNGGGSDGS